MDSNIIPSSLLVMLKNPFVSEINDLLVSISFEYISNIAFILLPKNDDQYTIQTRTTFYYGMNLVNMFCTQPFYI